MSTRPRPIRPGDSLPDFERTDHRGQAVRAADLRGRWAVIYFYPKNGTPLCTAQGCAFRDAYERLTDAGAAVVGVSGDSPASHAAFAARHRLPYALVSDADGSLRRLLGVPRTMWLLPGRVTYTVDPAGVVRSVFNSPATAARHVETALLVICADGAATPPGGAAGSPR
jgi:peroxiredoxin Q/BCP